MILGVPSAHTYSVGSYNTSNSVPSKMPELMTNLLLKFRLGTLLLDPILDYVLPKLFGLKTVFGSHSWILTLRSFISCLLDDC